MKALQYKIIKSDIQYNKYCDIMEALVESGKKTKAIQDEIELFNLLILMAEHKLRAVDLAKLLQVSEGLISDMLNYKKSLSKGYDSHSL